MLKKFLLKRAIKKNVKEIKGTIRKASRDLSKKVSHLRMPVRITIG
jgi:hypothetical protein